MVIVRLNNKTTQQDGDHDFMKQRSQALGITVRYQELSTSRTVTTYIYSRNHQHPLALIDIYIYIIHEPCRNDKILLTPMKGAAWHKVLLKDVARMPRLGDFQHVWFSPSGNWSQRTPTRNSFDRTLSYGRWVQGHWRCLCCKCYEGWMHGHVWSTSSFFADRKCQMIMVQEFWTGRKTALFLKDDEIWFFAKKPCTPNA